MIKSSLASPKGGPDKPISFKPKEFLQGSIAELKQVIWPTKKTVIRLTIVIISVSLLTGLIIGGLDYLFLNLVGLLVK